MIEGAPTTPRRLPFSLQAAGGVGLLTLRALSAGPLTVDALELEVSDLPAEPSPPSTSPPLPAERYQRRRTRLRTLAIHLGPAALDERLDHVKRQLAALGITQLAARLDDGYVSVRARAADGLAAADVSFRVVLVSAGALLRAMASTIRVHGHLPTPGPLVADRILTALFAATDAAAVVERPRVRGLCDIEIDLVGSLLWHLLPPSGWRLPAVADIEFVTVKVTRSGVDVAYGPAGSRNGELGLRPHAHQLAAALDLMHSVDAQLRDGHLDDAMRGYRGLLAAGGPDQPHVLERILALASARAPWFFDGLELARQALGRWSAFPPAHATLASITLAQGDAREAATHLKLLAQLASSEGDDLQAAVAALAGARLLRVLDPKAATQLFQLALEHDPASTEAAESLADRLADEQRWTELVRLVRARAAITTEPDRALQLRLRLADVLAHHLNEPLAAQAELAAARAIAPNEPSVAELSATILARTEPAAAVDAWREVARLADARDDHRTSARAWAALGSLLAGGATTDTARVTAVTAWQRAVELDPLQADAVAGLAHAAAERGDAAAAVALYERLRGLGLAPAVAATHEVALARAYLAIGRPDDARASLRRATLVTGETAAEAHAVLAELAEATADREHAAAELDTAIVSLVGLARDAGASPGAAAAAAAPDSDGASGDGDRLLTRAAELAIARATLFDRTGQPAAASADYARAHQLAGQRAPGLARNAARTLLDRAGSDANTERRWIDAVLATRPPPAERASLLVRRADVRRRERVPDLAAALADLHEGLQSLYDLGEAEDPAVTQDIRRTAYQLEADLLASGGDPKARAQALASLARMAERAAERASAESAAAAAWLAADDPGAALPEAARAHATLEAEGADGSPALRRDVLLTLGEAAWRQRAWPDVLRAYAGLLAVPPDDTAPLAVFRYRLAVGSDRTGDAARAAATLRPFLDDEAFVRAAPPEVRSQALRLASELAERAGDLAGAAAALEQIVAVVPDGGRDTGDSGLADAMYRAGELFRRAGRSDDAVRCFDGALRVSETHLPALDALETAWRERGDSERVSVILGRKVAATARHPARQKPLLSRLGELQAQLGRPDVALATHQRALEIDATWRPSLRYVTHHLRETEQLVAAAGGLAQLAGELPGDSGLDLAVLLKERQQAARALADLVEVADDAQLEAVRAVALPVLERAAGQQPVAAEALARLRGENPAHPAASESDSTGEDTHSGKLTTAVTTALSLREAAARARGAGKREDAFATLEAANHVNPGDPALVRELVDLAGELGDHASAARHLTELAQLHGPSGVQRGNTLLELADVYYDRLDDLPRGRQAMRAAAEAFGIGARRDSTLRMLAQEAGAHLAWDMAVDALTAVPMERRSAEDIVALARALLRAGRDAEGLALVEAATAAGRIDDGGMLFGELHAELQRKAALARAFDGRASAAAATEAAELRAEAQAVRTAIGIAEIADRDFSDEVTADLGLHEAAPRAVVSEPPALPRTRTAPGVLSRDREKQPSRETGPISAITQAPADLAATPAAPAEAPPAAPPPAPAAASPAAPKLTDSQTLARIKLVKAEVAKTQAARVVAARAEPGADGPSVVITGSEGEERAALALALAAADRDTLLAARRACPDDAGVLLALLAHLGDREPALRREVLEDASRTASGRALAVALDQLAHLAREGHDATRATSLWARAHEIDPTYAPVWMPLADALAAADDLDTARELYELVASSTDYSVERRAFAQARAAALGHDATIISGEIQLRVPVAGSVEMAAVLPAITRETPAVPPPAPEPAAWVAPALAEARTRAEAGDVLGAIAAAQEAADTAPPGDVSALELLEQLYLETGDTTSASDAIGRQLAATGDAHHKSLLWRRRARLYRDALGRDADAYRCLKEAQALAPADPEIAYQLRVAAMVRGEWALAASLLYREIAAAGTPRERGALHLELALVYEERLDDDAQAQVNYEQALAFDPTIPAAKLPLARRYDALGRHADAARMYDEAAATARAGDRAALHDAADRARAAAAAVGRPHNLGAQIERSLAAGNLDEAHELAHQLWRSDPGDPIAFRVLANEHRAAGDLDALGELTSVRVSRAETGEERAAAWLEVARLAEDVGALEAAARAYDDALVEDPGHVEALDARGALAFRLGDFATAELRYRDLAPADSALGADELAHRRSIISERLGRDTEALAHAQAAAAAAPGRSDLMMRVQELATRIGDLELALTAARAVHELVPLDDDVNQLRTQLALVDLLRQAGDVDGAIAQLDRIRRDHPFHEATVEALAELHIARGDWVTATRYLYQLVPMAPTPAQRADRLYRLGEAVLLHLGDAERADDVFLRASDLDPAHVPTLRRLLDVYWRADEPGQLVEVAAELAGRGALTNGLAARTLARALVAAALLGDAPLAQQLATVLGSEAPRQLVGALTELADHEGRLQLRPAATAVGELGSRGVLDLTGLRSAATGTPVEPFV